MTTPEKLAWRWNRKLLRYEMWCDGLVGCVKRLPMRADNQWRFWVLSALEANHPLAYLRDEAYFDSSEQAKCSGESRLRLIVRGPAQPAYRPSLDDFFGS